MRIGPRRRDPVSRDRYRAIARGAGVRAPVRPRGLHVALAVTLGVVALIVTPRAAGAVGTGLEQLVASIQSAVPLLQGRASIDLPAGGSTSVGAAPIADSLPAYTRDPQLQLTGKVPSFAVQAGRSVQFVLNGAVVATTPSRPRGATFSRSTATDRVSHKRLYGPVVPKVTSPGTCDPKLPGVQSRRDGQAGYTVRGGRNIRHARAFSS